MVADVHGFYSELQASLNVKRFCEDKEPHKPVVCGDLLGLANGLLIECCCPHCGGTHFKKSGYYGNGTRRYRCLDCGKAFSPLTGTVFDSHKIPISEWSEYVMHLFEFHSLSSSARDNRNAKTYPIVPHQHKWRKNEDGHFTHEKGEKIK